MEKIYFDEDKKILDMFEKNPKMTETDEDKTEFSYNGKRVIVSTPYLNRLLSQGNYEERTIGSLTGIRIGAAFNTAKSLSSYASELSQTKGTYEGFPSRRKPLRRPRRLFSD